MTPDEYLEELRARGREAVDQAGASSAHVATVVGEGTDETGHVTVVLGGDGRLSSISIDPRALRDGSERLEGRITEAMHAAHDELQERLAELQAPLLALTEQLTGAHGSFASALESMTSDIQARFDQAREDLQRRMPEGR